MGAVGVMQIKPSTAAGTPINITGVAASAESNFHAGVKYLRFIVDRYYADEPMDRINNRARGRGRRIMPARNLTSTQPHQ